MMRRLLLLLAFVAATPALAADKAADGDPNAVGHSADGYYLDSGLGPVLELPRLFLVQRADGSIGFDSFWSTKSAVNDPDYTLSGVPIKGTNIAEAVNMTSDEVEEAVSGKAHIYFPVVYAQEGGRILIDFSITRQLLFVFLSALLVLLLGLSLASKYKRGIGRTTAPRGTWHNMIETIVVFIRDDVAKPSIGVKYRKYLPYLLSVFFFILIGNLLGLVPLGVTATSHIMVTGALALVTFVVTQLAGTRDYWAHIFNPPGVPGFVKPILVPIEFVGLFTKPLALAFRLFGNMVSGHLVIVSILGLIFIFAARINPVVGGATVFLAVPITVFVYLLKIVVSFVQAYIFTTLSAVFIGMAAEEHHHDEHETPHEAQHARIPHGDGALKPGEQHLEDYLSPTPNHPRATVA
jgi:F-type H+-transporting ATPase subunit a